MALKFNVATDDYDVDIKTVYGVTHADYATILADNYANRAAVAVDLPGLDAYWTFQGLSDSDFNDANLMAMNLLPACVNDAVIQTDGYIRQGSYPDDGVASRGNIFLPHGGFKVNFPLLNAHGRMVGKGSSNYTNGQLQIYGAGTGAVNALYDRDGNTNSYPRYTKVGGVQDDDSVIYSGTRWEIYSGGVLMYHSTTVDAAGDPVNYPHKVATWVADGGTGGGTVSQRPSASGTTGGTQLIIDHNFWLEDCMEDRNCIQSTEWGNTGLSGYMEGSSIEYISCWGAMDEVDQWISDPGHYDNTYFSSGIAQWSSGSVSHIMFCKCDAFNDFGIALGDKPTPATLIGNRCFINQRGGVGVIGGGTVFSFSLECDGTPAVFYVREGYSQSPAQANITAIGIKVEDGPAPQIAYPKGCMIADIEAWTHLAVVGASMVSTFSFPDALVRVENTANQSYVSIDNLKIFGYYRTLLHDVANQKKWLVDLGEYAAKWNSSAHSYKWISNSNGQFVSAFGHTPPRTGVDDGRLAWLGMDGGGLPIGTFNDVAGTPAYDY